MAALRLSREPCIARLRIAAQSRLEDLLLVERSSLVLAPTVQELSSSF